MTTVLQLRFPAGGYHATPWGHHVNEGLVEWPPSPWRLLRALLATGFTKAGWDVDSPPPVARSLIEHLAAVAPTYALPDVATGHTRHYVSADAKTPLILDAFLRVEGAGILEICWDVDLPVPESTLLGQLATLLGYLGRAESWVEARLVAQPTRDPNCVPSDATDGPPGPGWDGVSVMGAMTAQSYALWYDKRTSPIRLQHQPAPGRRMTAAASKKLTKALAVYPVDLVAALSVETGWLQEHGWSAAPGSRGLIYWRRSGAVEVQAPMAWVGHGRGTQPLALLALSTPSRNRSALPPTARVLPQGRLLHRALASVVTRSGRADLARVLLGRADSGHSQQDHDHLHLLHLDLDDDGRLDHALLWAPAGLSADALAVVTRVQRTWMKGGVGELQVAYAGAGTADLFRQNVVLGRALTQTLGPPGGAQRWISATPYVAPRFTKRQGRDSLRGQIQLALERRGLPPADVELLDLRQPPGDAFRHVVLHDARHEPPVRVRYAVRLTFSVPVEGPVCLGYGCHVGLGRFRVDNDA